MTPVPRQSASRQKDQQIQELLQHRVDPADRRASASLGWDRNVREALSLAGQDAYYLSVGKLVKAFSLISVAPL